MAASVQGTGAPKGQGCPMAPGFLEPQGMHAVAALRYDQGAQNGVIALGHKDMAIQNMVWVI